MKRKTGLEMAGGLNNSINESTSANRICRDFLRNVCHRGKRCKYVHERSGDGPVDEYTFCHDFQNGVCNWNGCKFLHCTENEEKHYRATGQLPNHIVNQLKNTLEKHEQPLCKDFMKGNCQRNHCKFRHLTKDEGPQQNNHITSSNESINSPTNNFNNIPPAAAGAVSVIPAISVSPTTTTSHENPTSYHWKVDGSQHSSLSNNIFHTSAHANNYIGPTEPKRRLVSSEAVVHFETSSLMEPQTTQSVTPGYYYHPIIARNEARTIVVEDENTMLRKKIEELKKQVNDLIATNEFLLDQNAQLRMSGKRTANVTAVTVPAMTITNTVPPSQAPTPQQMVNAAVAAGTLRTVTASVATVPVSIATVTPVSIAAVSMAPVSVAPIVTMAQQTNQPTNQPSAPLVSYPIIT